MPEGNWLASFNKESTEILFPEQLFVMCFYFIFMSNVAVRLHLCVLNYHIPQALSHVHSF